ncbi:MarR family transcriptional regulator [Dermatophilaceae bacterium Soc4.6]
MAGDRADEERVQVDAVMRASRVLGAVVAQSISAVEDQVTFVQFRMLVVIASRGPLNLGEVARHLGVHPSNATRMVDKLVTAGLVERTDDLADRRYLTLTVTPTGHDIVTKVMNHRRQAISTVMDAMPASRRRTLASVLASFAEAAGEQPEAEEAFLLGLLT